MGRERRGPKGEPKQADAATLAALFETLDAAREGAMVHENPIAK